MHGDSLARSYGAQCLGALTRHDIECPRYHDKALVGRYDGIGNKARITRGGDV